MDKSVILTNTQIEHKIKRIAYQIYEANADRESVIVAGIAQNGFLLAKKIKKALEQISPLEIDTCEVIINKRNPLNSVTTSLPPKKYENRSVVLVDDVLNSGTTLMYAVKHFLEVPLAQFNTAVLVNRNHKKYPVKADFKGLSLSTSLQEHIQVEITSKKMVAYLS